MTSLVRLMNETLEDHRAYLESPRPPPPRPRQTIEEIPPMARKLKKEKIKCFHCHMVHDAERDLAREEKRWSREETLSLWPLPEKAGFIPERDDSSLLREVKAGSAAAEAGLRAGDRLVRVGEERVRSEADVQWALHQAPPGDVTVPVVSLRGGETKRATLRLAKGWKTPSDAEFSWRASMWSLRPMPGFGGRTLKEEDLRTAGLEPGTFALRVDYLVDWGEDAATGQSARKAGLKKGDLILSVDGKKDFHSELHFQSWFRFTRKAGSLARLEILRPGGSATPRERIRIDLPVLP
jgi:hypothetical protein